MEKFTVLKGIAAPLPLANVDTDMIIPKQFLKTIKRTGLGKNLFDDMRHKEDGTEIENFILNKEPFRKAAILVAGENFGCGSSREHAPWALLDFGIRCVIAPSFADIFYNNCFKNGILPLALPQDKTDILMADAKAEQELTIDLPRQVVIRQNGEEIAFDIEDFRKHCLINGLDDIALTLESADKIKSYEDTLRHDRPWLIGA